LPLNLFSRSLSPFPLSFHPYLLQSQTLTCPGDLSWVHSVAWLQAVSAASQAE
jgi:hypothetical protein